MKRLEIVIIQNLLCWNGIDQHFHMHRLINEVDDLLQQILDCPPAESLSYQFVFQEYVGLDPLSAER